MLKRNKDGQVYFSSETEQNYVTIKLPTLKQIFLLFCCFVVFLPWFIVIYNLNLMEKSKSIFGDIFGQREFRNCPNGADFSGKHKDNVKQKENETHKYGDDI